MKILDLKEIPVTSICSIGISEKIIKKVIVKNNKVFIKFNTILPQFILAITIDNIEKELQVKFDKTTNPLIQSFQASESNLLEIRIEDKNDYIQIIIKRELVNYEFFTKLVEKEQEE